MQRIKTLLHDDDSAVSPVIGVILMVAITVILAAVIASFVLGLGDADDPAPNPTISSDFSSEEIELSVTGGDDFEADVSELQVELDDNGTQSEQIRDEDDINADDYSISMDISGDEVTAGDSITISYDDDWEIEEYDIQIVFDPADQDSEVIYSDSG